MSRELTNPVKWFNENFRQYVEKMSLDKEHMQGYKELLNHFQQMLDKDAKILDAGCGWGRDVNYFLDNGYDAIGVDKAPAPLKFGSKKYKANNVGSKLHRMDVAELGFQKNTFDGVWCNSVIHFYEPDKMHKPISEMSRVLKKGGLLYINFKLTEGSPEPDVREESDGALVERYLVPAEMIKNLLEENGLKYLEGESLVNTEDFENHVWSIFCRKK